MSAHSAKPACFSCRGVSAVVAVIAILCASGCQQKAPDLVQDARRLITESKRNAAIIQLKNALITEPNNADTLFLLGKTYWEIGDLASAETHLRAALKLESDNSRMVPLLGRVLLERENYHTILSEIISSPSFENESRAEVALLRGHAYLATGEFAEARGELELAKSVKPIDAELGIAKIAVVRGELAAAEKIVDQLLSQAPSDAHVWLLKGDLLKLQGHSTQSLEAYTRASTAQPDHVTAYLAQAVHHINSGNLVAAQGAITKAHSLAPLSPAVGFSRALVLLREKKFNECRDALQRVFVAIPEHMPSILVAATLSHTLGELEQAQHLYTRYLLKFPASIYGRKMLADTLIRNAQPQSALFLLQPFLMHTELADGEILALAAQAHLQLGQYAEAIRHLEVSVALDPKDSAKLTTLAASRLAAGDSTRGLNELEAAVQINASDLRARQLLVVTLIGRKELGKAMEVVLDLEKTHPSHPLVYSLKSAVLVAQKDFAGARASLEQALKIQPSYFPAAAALAQLDLRQNDRAAARGRLLSTLAKDQNNLETMIALAGLAFGEGQLDEAIKWLLQAVTAHPQNAQAHVLLAQVYLQKKQPEAALEAARKARKLNMSDPQSIEVMGAAQTAVNDIKGAIASYLALTRLMPMSAAAHVSLARAYARSGDDRSATAVTQKALELQPASLDALLIMADMHLRAKRYPDVSKLALQLREQHSDLVQGYVLEGDVHWAQKSYGAAAKWYEAAAARQKTGRLLIRLHQSQTLANIIASDALLLDWLKTTPADVEVRGYLARVYLDSGLNKDAVVQYKQLIRYDPKNVVALNSLAWALQDESPDEAIKYAQQAFNIQPEDAAVLDTLGWLLVKNNQLMRGMTLLRQALALDPETPEIRLHFAKALLKANDIARARSELEIVIANGKPSPAREEARTVRAKLGH